MPKSMLQIPFKTSAPTDVVSPLNRFVTSEWSASTSAEHMEGFRSLQLLRNAACDVKSASDVGLRTLRSYGAQLESLKPRLPAGSTALQLELKWKDAFQKSKTAEQSSLDFELAAIVFNCGAHESQVAAGGSHSHLARALLNPHMPLMRGVFRSTHQAWVDPPTRASKPPATTSRPQLGTLTSSLVLWPPTTLELEQ